MFTPLTDKVTPVILAICISLVLLPGLTLVQGNGAVDAASESDYHTIDAWTDRGGIGAARPGGSFKVGERVIIYLRAKYDFNAWWDLKKEVSVALNGTVAMKALQTYPLDFGLAEKKDVGQWKFHIEATIPGRGFADYLDFAVVDSTLPQITPSPAVPSGGTSLPDVLSKPTGATGEKVNEANATGIDALLALKMAGGQMPANNNLDANGDGKVTAEDASLILKWSVSSASGTLSAAQQQIIDSLGYPDQFSVTYLLDDPVQYDFLVRMEIWYYPVHQKKITFIAGEV